MCFNRTEEGDVLDQFNFNSFLQDNADHALDFDVLKAFAMFDSPAV